MPSHRISSKGGIRGYAIPPYASSNKPSAACDTAGKSMRASNIRKGCNMSDSMTLKIMWGELKDLADNKLSEWRWVVGWISVSVIHQPGSQIPSQGGMSSHCISSKGGIRGYAIPPYRSTDLKPHKTGRSEWPGRRCRCCRRSRRPPHSKARSKPVERKRYRRAYRLNHHRRYWPANALKHHKYR